MIKLSESQKYDVIRILRNLASLDWNFNQAEAARIRMIGLKMDLHVNKIDEALAEDFEDIGGIQTRLKRFEEESQQKFLYQQCLLLLMADRKISTEEREAIEGIRPALGLDQAFHEQIMAWVEEYATWEQRGEELVGGPLYG